MNEARLAEIEARAAAATPGEWETWATYVFVGGQDGATVLAASEPRASTTVGYTPPAIGSPDLKEAYANATFAAAAHQDVPALVAEVRRLRDALLDYGRHAADCVFWLDDEGDLAAYGPEGCCTCGWYAASRGMDGGGAD